MNHRVVSTRFPYLPIQVEVAGQSLTVEALLDTGFDGDLVLPRSLLGSSAPPDGRMDAVLADGSSVETPVYVGQVRLGTARMTNIAVMALGEEPIVGRGISDRFSVTLDHGRQVIVEP